jgi:hypothetical protein
MHPSCHSLAVLFNEPQELIMSEYFDSASEVSRKAIELDSDVGTPHQQHASAGTFELRRALYFQRNVLGFQANGTEAASLYKTATNVHELFPYKERDG